MKGIMSTLKSRSGFSLIEVMAAVVMIVVLMSIVIPNIAGMSKKGRLDADIISASSIGKAVELYLLEAGDDANANTQAEIIEEIEDRGYIKKVGKPKSNGCAWSIEVDDSEVEVGLEKDGKIEVLYPQND